jgi:ATP-dependent protease ClpP protease subunit
MEVPMKLLSALALAALLLFSGAARAADHAMPLPSELMTLLEGDEANAPLQKMECPTGKDQHCVMAYRFDGPVTESTVKPAISFLKSASESKIPVVMLEINTSGGSVDDGFELMRAIEMASPKVVCVVDGEAASMGFFILQSCDYRIMTKRSVLMAHQVMARDIPSLNPTQGQNLVDHLKVICRAYAEGVSERSGIPVQAFLDRHAKGDWNMNWDEALANHFIDQPFAGSGNKLYHNLLMTGKPGDK